MYLNDPSGTFLVTGFIGVTKKMSNQVSEPKAGGADPDRSHLEDVESGAGCTEIWEALSERRAKADAAAED